MVRIICVHGTLTLLRPLKDYDNTNYHALCKIIAKKVIRNLCESTTSQNIAVLQPANSKCEHRLGNFSCDIPELEQAVEELQEPDLCSISNFEDAIKWTLNEIHKYWGPAAFVQILIFTDGDASIFNSALPTMDTASCYSTTTWPNVSLIFVSINDEQLSSELFHLHQRFLPNSKVICLDQYMQGGRSLDELSGICADVVIRACTTFNVTNSLSTEFEVTIRCGHLSEPVTLSPALHISCSESVQPPFSVETFGFLHISDLNNPPVCSRHSVNCSSKTDTDDFLSLLLVSMQETKTVGMCSIFVEEKPSSLKSKSIKRLWRYGFLHQFDGKSPFLLLSIFDKDCSGLPWLGQFEHLAPVEDFAGIQLYDDREGSSPFPVLVPDRLSYGTFSDSNASGRLTAGATEPFRYVSWVSSPSMLTDVNKVLRLGRRLPEKSHVFFKELSRVCSAALAYGCPDLLGHISRLIEDVHAPELQSNGPNAQAIQAHLVTMQRILTESVPTDTS